MDGHATRCEPLPRSAAWSSSCQPATRDNLPDYATRRRIERQVTKTAHEHLIIYVDAAKTTQVWQWVTREPGNPWPAANTTYHAGQSGDA